MSHESYSVKARRIDPTRKTRPDGSPLDNDRVEIGPTPLAFQEWSAQGLEMPDLTAMREYRLARVRKLLADNDYGGILLTDPLNIRYALDSNNMHVWAMHDTTRAAFIPTEGAVVLFDFAKCEFLSEHLPLVDEVRPLKSFIYFFAAEHCQANADSFAREVDELLKKYAGENRRLAMDKMEICAVRSFEDLGIRIQHGQTIMELARVIKSADEVKAMRCAASACETAMALMRKTMRPGMSESELWAVLHAENIRRGGEWIETRCLASGPRTNPWFHECGPRVMEEGDIVAFDTDMVGCYGYCVDISRTWVCGERNPTAEQRALYRVGYDHIMENMALLRPGLSFFDMTYKGHRLPLEYRELQYAAKYHGIGLCDEYPAIRYPEDMEEGVIYKGVLEEGMMLTAEAYVGVVGGREGVKLEEQVLITSNGYEPLTAYPFEKELLA